MTVPEDLKKMWADYKAEQEAVSRKWMRESIAYKLQLPTDVARYIDDINIIIFIIKATEKYLLQIHILYRSIISVNMVQCYTFKHYLYCNIIVKKHSFNIYFGRNKKHVFNNIR